MYDHSIDLNTINNDTLDEKSYFSSYQSFHSFRFVYLLCNSHEILITSHDIKVKRHSINEYQISIKNVLLAYILIKITLCILFDTDNITILDQFYQILN